MGLTFGSFTPMAAENMPDQPNRSGLLSEMYSVWKPPIDRPQMARDSFLAIVR